MANCTEIAEAVSGKTFEGEQAAAVAERYPGSLVQAILDAHRSCQLRLGRLHALCAGPSAEEPDALSSDAQTVFQQQVYDESTGLELPRELVQKAKQDEMDFMYSLNVLF